MNGLLQGRHILMTGAGSCIGSATAICIANMGAQVVVSDIAEQGGRETADRISQAGGKALFIRADVGVESEVQRLVQGAVSAFGRLHGAFNNAGISQRGKILHELSTEEWDRAIRVDLTSVFWCMKYEVLAMLEAGGGAIVNTASSLAQVALTCASEYVSAKHGVVGNNTGGRRQLRSKWCWPRTTLTKC